MRAKLVEELRAVLLRDGAGLTDGQLLECFIARRDDAAFEALVRRHGPMVLAVCRRILRNHHDSEDAFQATFLVLARKAPALGSPQCLGPWLHGVAFRTAVLEKQGWNLHRLWTPHFFRDPKGSIKAIAAAAAGTSPAPVPQAPQRA